MEPEINAINPENIRLISIEDRTIKILLKGDTEVVLEFKDRAAMERALALWARRPELAPKLPG